MPKNETHIQIEEIYKNEDANIRKEAVNEILQRLILLEINKNIY